MMSLHSCHHHCSQPESVVNKAFPPFLGSFLFCCCLSNLKQILELMSFYPNRFRCVLRVIDSFLPNQNATPNEGP